MLAGTLNPVSLAAHTIALNAVAVTYMVPLGNSSAAAVSVGRAWGGGDPAHAARAGWTSSSPARSRKHIHKDARVIAASIRLLAIAAAFQLFDGIQAATAGALRGLGDTRTPMVWTVIAYWVIGLPSGCRLCYRRDWGVFGIGWGLCAGLMLVARPGVAQAFSLCSSGH